MTKINHTFYLLFFMVFVSLSDCNAGVTIVGTSFNFNNETKSINIKVINDEDSDYLIITKLNSIDFIVYPPLFILKKNTSNIITIIPREIKDKTIDHVYDLIIATIPRSEAINKNSISLAVRSHFNVFYNHKKPSEGDFHNVFLVKNKENKFELMNNTKFIFNVLVYNKKNQKVKLVLYPNKSNIINGLCVNSNCDIKLYFIDGNNSIISKVNLNYKK